jgi:hypothetical protein
MKTTILTITFILLSLISNSQTITVTSIGLQNYFRPKNLSLKKCQDDSLINYTFFGNGKCDYVFDLDKNEFTMRQWDGSVSKFKIDDFTKSDLFLQVNVDLTNFVVIYKGGKEEPIFLIEYHDLPDKIEGRFAREKDFIVTIN